MKTAICYKKLMGFTAIIAFENYKRFLCLIFSLMCFSSQVFAQTELFFQDKPMSVVLKAPFTKLLQQRQQVAGTADEIKSKTIPLPGTLILLSEIGNPVTEIPVQVDLRGHTSLLESQCDFPKLKIIFRNYKKSENAEVDPTLKTIFSNTEKLDLGTHCSVRGGFSPQLYRSWTGTSPHREALAYRLLNELGVPTLKAQMLYVDYVDSENGRIFGAHRQAFFLEDTTAAANRLKGVEYFSVQKKYNNPEKASRALFHFVQEATDTNQTQVAVMLLFENLIRNNDWKLRVTQDQAISTFLWNVKVIKLLSLNAYYVLPYDFDLSEVVSGYSRSDENIKYYNSLVGAEAFTSAVQIYKDKKKDLYRLITLLPDVYSQRLLKKNLDRFYSQLP